MKNILKDKVSVYLFNAYSNLDPKISFISGSDRVGLNLINIEKNQVIVIAPKLFKPLLSKDIIFYSSDDTKFKNLFLCYFLRVFNSIYLLNKVKNNFLIEKVVSTSDFFPDVIPSFIISFITKWYAFTYHLYPLNINLRNLVGRFLQIISYILFFKSEKCVTSSQDCEKFLKDYFFIKLILKVPFGLDLKKYLKKTFKNSELVFLGRIKNSKGVYDLPEIISILKKEHPNIKLKIIGNGKSQDIEKLKDLINKFKIKKNIVLLQNLNDAEVISELNQAKILVQPSYEEGFGLSVLEALASNMEVVLYDLPVYKEHFDEFKLNYVEIGDKVKFAQEISEILKSKREIQRSFDLFKKFSWSDIFNNIFKD